MKPKFSSAPAILITLLALLALLAVVVQQARPSTEAVRLRNALLWDQVQPADFSWTPDAVPAGYAVDAAGGHALFDGVARQLRLADAATDWERSLRIARHLLDNPRFGGPAMDDLAGTYRQILAGNGYCADYTTTFIGIARSAGIFAREWAFSFDGFGGHGHAFTEVFDRDARRWRFLDSFNNFYVVDKASGEPLSAMEFRDRLRNNDDRITIVKAGPGRLGMRDAASVLRYYREGADQWYLWWGNAVVRYDESLVVRTLGRLSRSLEQLGAMAMGVHPRIHAIATDSNASMRQRMVALGWQMLAALVAGCALALLLLVQVRQRLRRHAPTPAG